MRNLMLVVKFFIILIFSIEFFVSEAAKQKKVTVNYPIKIVESSKKSIGFFEGFAEQDSVIINTIYVIILEYHYLKYKYY